MSKKTYSFLGFWLFLGLVIGGHFIGNSLERISGKNSSISVQGIAERFVKADSATWKIPFKVVESTLDGAKVSYKKNQEKILNFLKKHGIAEDEVTLSGSGADTFDYNQSPKDKVSLRGTLFIDSKNPEKVHEAFRSIDELLEDNILLDSFGNSFPRYALKNLESLRAELMADALKNAHQTAETVVVSSGSQVGRLKNVKQGKFFMEPDQQQNFTGDDYSHNLPRENYLNKKVRAVIHATYVLES